MRALIMTANGVEDSEYFYPYYRLIEEGVDVDVAAPARQALTGKHGYMIEPDKTFDEVDPNEYELLVLPGGSGPETVRNSDAAVSVTRKMNEANKPIAAVCHGAQVLISSCDLKGREMTCWWGIADDLKAAGANWVDREVAVDGNFITSRCPDDLPAFCREILRAIQ